MDLLTNSVTKPQEGNNGSPCHGLTHFISIDQSVFVFFAAHLDILFLVLLVTFGPTDIFVIMFFTVVKQHVRAIWACRLYFLNLLTIDMVYRLERR